MSARVGVLVAIGGVGLVTQLVAAGHAAPLWRWASFAFLLVGPGWAWVRNLHLDNAATELTLAVTTSLAILATVSTLLLMVDWWSTSRMLLIVAVLTAAGAVVNRFGSAQDRSGSRRRPRRRAARALRSVNGSERADET